MDPSQNPIPNQPLTVPAPAYAAPAGPALVEENPNKNYLLTLAFALVFGGIGLDRFYLNKVGTGILKLLTLGGGGIWLAIDLILVATGRLRQKADPRPLEGYAQYNKMARIPTIVVSVILMVAAVFTILMCLLLLAVYINNSIQNP